MGPETSQSGSYKFAHPKERVIKQYISSMSDKLKEMNADELKAVIVQLPAFSGPSADTKRKLIKQCKMLLAHRYDIWVY